MIHLETDRLVLRELVPSDAADLFYMDSDTEVHRYLGGHIVTDIEQSLETIRWVQQQYREKGIGRWAVERKDSGECIGWAGLKFETKARPGREYYDLGYRLKKTAWGQGFASEAARASLDYGFETMGLQTINAAAHIDNAASNAILRKLGFRFIELFEYDGMSVNWYELDVQEWKRSQLA